MSIEHELIAELFEQHEGHHVHVTSTRRGAPIPAFRATIPADYDGNIVLVSGALVAVPARGTRYTEIVVTDANDNVVQRLLPARSGSTERAILARRPRTSGLRHNKNVRQLRPGLRHNASQC